MLTIGQLAAHAGVTVRTVRHYHEKGLLPEPDRDHSGYRRYDAKDVVRLIKIRTLADAGVPLARVEELLDASPEDFDRGVAEIDRRLRAEIRERQEHRRRIARLAAGDSLALPEDVVAYLARLRDVGLPDEAVELERDMWILIAARWPDEVARLIADKTEHLADPLVGRLYGLIARLGPVWEAGDGASQEVEDLLHEVADVIVELMEDADARGGLESDLKPDGSYTALLDAFAEQTHPATARLQEIMSARGWRGWTFMTRDGAPDA